MLGWEFNSWIRLSTRCRVSSPMSLWLRMTLETVTTDSPSSRAMSFIVTAIFTIMYPGAENRDASAALGACRVRPSRGGSLDRNPSVHCQSGLRAYLLGANTLSKAESSTASTVAETFQEGRHR